MKFEIGKKYYNINRKAYEKAIYYIVFYNEVKLY